MAPILTNIEAGMVTLIEGMTTAGGYNYDWSTVNNSDMALQSYPAAEIFIDPEETCLDDFNGSHANAYYNEVEFKIITRTNLSAVDSTPTFKINEEFNKMLDDLKKLFGTNQTVGSTACIIMYRGSRRINKTNGDIFVPGDLETDWVVRYGQDRTSPETVA